MQVGNEQEEKRGGRKAIRGRENGVGGGGIDRPRSGGEEEEKK